MALPNIPELEDALASLAAGSAGTGESFELVPARNLEDAGGMRVSDPVIGVLPQGTRMSVAALHKRIAGELEKQGHPATTAAASAVLALFLLCRDKSRSAVAQLSDIIESVVTVDVIDSAVAAFPPHPQVRTFAIDRFTAGPLDLEKMRYRCSRVGCDFFELYPQRFENRFAIESRVQRQRALDIPRLRPAAHPTALHPHHVIDAYFEALTAYRKDVFLREFRDAQLVYAAAGAPLIDLQDVFAWRGSVFVAVYQGFAGSRTGYFCPLAQAVTVDFAQVDRRFPAVRQALESDYGFQGLGSSELHANLRIFCEFIVQGNRHAEKDEAGDALLKFVIALELLFGEKSRSNESVSTRAGLILALQSDTPLDAAVREVASIYDKRSRYVHAGQQPQRADVDRAKAVCDAVLRALLLLQGLPSAGAKGYLATWWSHLDYVAAALRAGRPLGADDLSKVGVAIRAAAKLH